MAIILSANEVDGHPPQRRRWVYNALDSAITSEVFTCLLPLVENDPQTDRFYRFQMAQQCPAFAMSMRGIRVDPAARARAEADQAKVEREAIKTFEALAAPFWKDKEKRKGKCEGNKLHKWTLVEGKSVCSRCNETEFVPKPCNPHSHVQMKKLFYEYMELPPQKDHKTHKVSTGDEALETLKRKFPEYEELIDAKLEATKARKQLGLLRSTLDTDGRWRSSFNVGAAVTGRWSSSKSSYWTGGNIQNIADRSRHMFVADPGLVMFYADYEQAESRIIAYDAEDEGYIAAHAGGDPHTAVATMVWPADHDWTGDLGADRKLADLPASFDPHHSLRDYAKHVGHGTAIGMTPHGIARDAHVKLAVAREAQEQWFKAFGYVRARQDEIWREVQETGQLTSPLGRRRIFLGRLVGDGAAATRREALAQTQQSMIVDWVGIALTRVWREMDGRADTPHPSQPCRLWLLAQVHDAILGLVRPGDDATLVELSRLMGFHLDIKGRRMVIPTEIMIGPNWRKADMKKWSMGMEWPK